MDNTGFVFLSYSSTDAEMANQIVEFLESAGIICWMAPRDIDPGDDWAESIMLALKNASTMVLLLSERSNNSVQVRREVEQAVRYEHPIITLRTEPLEPSLALQYYISAHHWVDASDGALDEHLKRVAAILRKKTGMGSPHFKTDKGGESEPIEPKRSPVRNQLESRKDKSKLRKRRLAMVFPAAVLAFGLAYVFGFPRLSDSELESNGQRGLGVVDHAVGLKAQSVPVAIPLALASLLPGSLSREDIDSITVDFPAISIAAAFRSDLDSATKVGLMLNAASMMIEADTLPRLRLEFLLNIHEVSCNANWGSGLQIDAALLLGQHYQHTLEDMPCNAQTAQAYTQHMQKSEEWYATCLNLSDEYGDMETFSQACLLTGDLYEMYANNVRRIPVPEPISDNEEAIAVFYEEMGSQFYGPKLDQVRQIYVHLLERSYSEDFSNTWTHLAEQYLAVHHYQVLNELRDDHNMAVYDEGQMHLPGKPE